MLDTVAYNDYKPIRSMCYNILCYLMENNEEIWKLLKYNTPDALYKPNLTMDEKRALIFNGNGKAEEYRVFRSAFLDDIFTKECSQLRIYVTTLSPDNRSVGTVDIGIECVVHNKLINIDSYESRLEVLVQQVIETLNGKNIGGIGVFFFDKTGSMYDLARVNIYNNRNFFGFTLIGSSKVASLNGWFGKNKK